MQISASAITIKGRVQAGFPSPADDYLEEQINLQEHLIRRPAATFVVRVSGNNMTKEGILSGDLLVVDRSLSVYNGCIAIVVLNGELFVRKLLNVKDRMQLQCDTDIKAITEREEIEVWGVVSSVVRDVRSS